MPYSVEFDAPAQRDLDRLPQRIVAAVVEFAFGPLADNPQRLGKPLRFELAGLYSARRGPYRLLYEIDDPSLTVHVIRIRHRADSYRTS